MKKSLIALAVLVGLSAAAVVAYRLASPEIVVANVSRSTIDEVIIQLPSSRVAFGALPPGTESAIYHAASQADGTYRYAVRFADGQVLEGNCGCVTNADHGKLLQIVVAGPDRAECRESNKIF